MLSSIQKSIIIKAVKIRIEQGEEAERILESYSRLTEGERKEILELVMGVR